jgi:hypothetical protein
VCAELPASCYLQNRLAGCGSVRGAQESFIGGAAGARASGGVVVVMCDESVDRGGLYVAWQQPAASREGERLRAHAVECLFLPPFPNSRSTLPPILSHHVDTTPAGLLGCRLRGCRAGSSSIHVLI